MSGHPGDFFADGEGSVLSADPPNPPRRGARRGTSIGLLALAVIVVVGILAGVVDHVVGRPRVQGAPIPLVTSVPAAAVESSSWYCLGGTSAPGSDAASTLNIVNTTGQVSRGVMEVVGDNGHVHGSSVEVPPHSQIVVVPGPLVGGSMVATTFTFSGGGVLVTQSFGGPLGWSEASCSRSLATHWYFASGATLKGDTLTLSLYNPTSANAVVDTTFVTPSGIQQPQPFQGIVVPPRAVVAVHVDAYVQDASSVASIVSVRSGAVVAAELETESGAGLSGISVRLGVPVVSSGWVLARSMALSGNGASTTIDVFNPTKTSVHVAIVVRAGNAPPARFTHVLQARSTWVFDTSSQTRIPAGLVFSARVSVLTGGGVVVDRSVVAPNQPGPQFGAIGAQAVGPDARHWVAAVLPAPGTQANPAVAGATLEALNLYNPGTTPLHATIWSLLGAGGRHRLSAVTLKAKQTTSIGTSLFTSVGRVPIEIVANRPIVAMEDLVPGATAGVVGLHGAGAGSL